MPPSFSFHPLGKVKIWMFWEIGEILPLQVPEPPIRESEDLDVLGDLENLIIAKYQKNPPPQSGKVKIWIFWETKKILPLQGSEPNTHQMLV